MDVSIIMITMMMMRIMMIIIIIIITKIIIIIIIIIITSSFPKILIRGNPDSRFLILDIKFHFIFGSELFLSKNTNS